ncbi:frequenin-1 [Acrasis kona]|uniref:Frequenin-1 n=1 Tax=Acrasis kona TaxID=1008807 RepID=A0AAW2ZHP9_9EUKA
MGQSNTKVKSSQILKDTGLSIPEITNKTKCISKKEIKQWYGAFKQQYPSGQMKREQFVETQSKLVMGRGKKFFESLFDTFDKDKSGSIDFVEFLIGMGAGVNGSIQERLLWTFNVYDLDGDHFIQQEEMTLLIKSLLEITHATQGKSGDDEANEQILDQQTNSIVSKIYKALDKNHDNVLSKEEFVDGCSNNEAILKALSITTDYLIKKN